ncbi:MAG: hypothetical protein KGJ58_01720 [Patescibacteria group bacterium]|nr:hypothetical protein [Patescibacteria group bacterium]MDE1988802.1 hypothetical protein [Patescibacteria group bacterium]MDE2218157.1 hypothetical protein [Patescibacteria group bacterium]
MSNFFIYKNKSGGFVKGMLIVIAAIIIFSFFVDIRSLTESKHLQDNYQYLKTLLSSLWVNYISSAIFYVWNKIFVKLIYTDLFLHIILPKLHLKTP